MYLYPDIDQGFSTVCNLKPTSDCKKFFWGTTFQIHARINTEWQKGGNDTNRLGCKHGLIFWPFECIFGILPLEITQVLHLRLCTSTCTKTDANNPGYGPLLYIHTYVVYSKNISAFTQNRMSLSVHHTKLESVHNVRLESDTRWHYSQYMMLG